MQLNVIVGDNANDCEPIELVVLEFDDLDKIAAKVARSVKAFLRSVPVRKALSRRVFYVTAQYTEASAATPAKKRKRARKAEGGSYGAQ